MPAPMKMMRPPLRSAWVMISTPCAMRSFSFCTAAMTLRSSLIDHLDDVANGSLVDGEADRVDRFGRKRLPLGLGRHRWSVVPADARVATCPAVQPLTRTSHVPGRVEPSDSRRSPACPAQAWTEPAIDSQSHGRQPTNEWPSESLRSAHPSRARGRGGRAARARAGQGHRRPAARHPRDPDRVPGRRPLPAARRARPRQDAAHQEAGRGGRPQVQPHPVHARPDAVRHPRRGGDRGGPRDRQARHPVHPRARSSRTSSSPTRSTARRRRRRRRCSRRCRSTRSRSTACASTSSGRCSCSRRRTRSSRKAPTRCPRRSSIASCSTS